MNKDMVRKQAEAELEIEYFEIAVSQMKLKIREERARSFWRKLFPWRLSIVRLDK